MLVIRYSWGWNSCISKCCTKGNQSIRMDSKKNIYKDNVEDMWYKLVEMVQYIQHSRVEGDCDT